MELEDACARLHEEYPDARRWIVAFSGGMDSRVLLDLCRRFLAAVPTPPRLEAIHVDHGVHADSRRWADQCREACAALGIALHLRRVRAPGGSEDALRRARYAAFESLCGSGDLLLLAHHRDDQAETVLLRLLRGAGPAGLAGMPASRPCGAARLCRPLLEVPRAQLRSHADAYGLTWIEDPSNANPNIGRNLVRHALMPQIERRWPGAAARIAGTASHCAEAESICRERAEEDLRACLGQDRIGLECLRLPAWRSLPSPRRGPVLRYWLRLRTGVSLEADALRRLRAELIDAAPDRHPEHAFGGWRLRRHAEGLYLGADLPAPPRASVRIEPGDALFLAGVGEILLASAGTGRPQALPDFQVAFPRRGMRCHLAGRPGKPLHRVLSEAGVPIWLRERVPLLFAGDVLLAVGGCGATEGHAPSPAGPVLRFCWIPDGAQGDAAHPVLVSAP